MGIKLSVRQLLLGLVSLAICAPSTKDTRDNALVIFARAEQQYLPWSSR